MQAFIKSQRASINFKIIVKSGLALKSVVPPGGGRGPGTRDLPPFQKICLFVYCRQTP